HLGITIPTAITSNTIDIAFDAAKINPDMLLYTIPMNLFGHPFFLVIYQAFNVPAFLITVAVTALLYIGVQESARTAAVMVFMKTAVVLLFIAVGGFFIAKQFVQLPVAETSLMKNWFAHGWKSFAPNGLGGIITGA